MRLIVSSLLLFILLIQLPHSFTQITCPTGQLLDTLSNSCVTTCPTSTYIGTQDAQAACVPQIPISVKIRPTPEERVYIVMFNNTPSPFDTVEMFQKQVRVSLDVFDYSQNITVSPVFLTQNKDIVQVTVNAQEIPRETRMFFLFPDLRNTNSSQGYITASKVLISLPYSELSSDDRDSINALTKLDRGLEYAWIAVTFLNPYAYLYMNTKLYRETLEMFKRVNVQYDSYATKFFLQNNNKISGFKAPNMFPILIEDDPVTSGWNRGEDNRLTYNGIDHDRIQDLHVSASDLVLKYDPFPLFLDNYGIQITVFLLIIVLIFIFELSNILFCCKRRQESSKVRKVFQAIRIYLRWNLLIASIIGSFQSLTFYFMVQMQAWSKQDDHNSHDKLNFWFAIGTIVVLAVFFPAWIIPKLAIIYKERKVNKNPCNYHEHYGIFVKITNLERRKSLTFLFVMMLRTAIFAALTLFLRRNPVAQVSVMVAFSILFMVYLVILRPFMRVFHFIYQILNEIVLIFYLTTLLFLAQEDDNGFVDSSEGDTTGKILIALWLFVPFVAIVFGMADIIMRLVRRPKSPQPSQKYFEPIVIVDTDRQEEERVVESGQKIMEGGDQQQEKELSLNKNPDLPTEIELNMINPASGEVEKETGFHENPRFEEEEIRGEPMQLNNYQSRRVPPNIPLPDRIGTIVEEEPEKEQASAKYIKPEEKMSEESAKYIKPEDKETEEQLFVKDWPKEQISALKQEKPRKAESATYFPKKAESATNFQPFQPYNSQTRLSEHITPEKYNTRNSYRATVPRDIEPEERESVRAPIIYMTPSRDNDNLSQDASSQSSITRTQDRVKALPTSLELAVPTTTVSKTKLPTARSSVRAPQTDYNPRRASHRVQQTGFPSLDDFMNGGRLNRNYHSLERKSVPTFKYVDEEAPRTSFRKKPIFEY